MLRGDIFSSVMLDPFRIKLKIRVIDSPGTSAHTDGVLFMTAA